MSSADMTVTEPSPPSLEAPSRASAGGRQTAAERARAATRAQLLASGRALFAELGLHKVTTHDIAAHAGVAAGTFYNHFSDKGALFRELTDAAIAELNRRLDECHESIEQDDTRPGVRAHAEALVGFAEDHRELLQILFSREADADAAAVESAVLDDMAASIAEVRAQSIAEGRMPAELDPTVLSQAIVGMWARVMAWWAEDPSRAPRESVIETLTQIQLGGTHPAARR
jgi:AcrR family transcriptional regulator